MTKESWTAVAVLLRGVNVGGNALSMAALRELLDRLGYEEISTYLQSGNVTLRARTEEIDHIEERLAEAIGAAHGRPVEVVVRSGAELARVAAANPFLGAGIAEAELHATFLKSPPFSEFAGALAPPEGCEDELALGERLVYVRCRAGYGNTKLNNAFIERRLKVPATTRNWRTVQALAERTSRSAA